MRGRRRTFIYTVLYSGLSAGGSRSSRRRKTNRSDGLYTRRPLGAVSLCAFTAVVRHLNKRRIKKYAKGWRAENAKKADRKAPTVISPAKPDHSLRFGPLRP